MESQNCSTMPVSMVMDRRVQAVGKHRNSTQKKKPKGAVYVSSSLVKNMMRSQMNSRRDKTPTRQKTGSNLYSQKRTSKQLNRSIGMDDERKFHKKSSIMSSNPDTRANSQQQHKTSSRNNIDKSINSMRLSYINPRPPHLPTKQRRNSVKKRRDSKESSLNSSGCNETVEYDSVMMPNHRMNKNTRRIDYDNGQPLALTDLGLMKFPGPRNQKNAITTKNSNY